MSRRELVVPLALLGLAACGQSAEPRAQWLVVVSTDAPVPQMGDRVLVEVLEAEGDALACSACRRVFGAVTPEDLPIEFGVTPSDTAGEVRVRARLTRSGDPDGTSSIDRVGSLREPSADAQVSLRLRMDCFGIAADPLARQSCGSTSGALAPEQPLPDVSDEPPLAAGSWPLAADTACAVEPDPEMICIPGGAFLLGDRAGVSVFDGSLPTAPERLVHLSPFHLDRDEFTLARYQALVEKGLPLTSPPLPAAECTILQFGDPGARDLPLNCVTREIAAEYCAAEGKRLPTEAEWEFAAGNRALESRYPWGSDDDVCAHAFVARSLNVGTCLVVGSTTLAPGLGPIAQLPDVSELGVRDLGGSLSEWVAGRAAPYASACFDSGERPSSDPLCDDATFPDVARGGNWASAAALARSSARSAEQLPQVVGFRCARSAN